MLILHETCDHWSVAVLTVTVHFSFFSTFDFYNGSPYIHTPTQRLLPVRFSIFHQYLKTWIITSFITIHLSGNVTPQAIYINLWPCNHWCSFYHSKFQVEAKGPKYREPCKVDWDKNLSLLCEAVDQYALQWAKREMVGFSVQSSWKKMVKGQTERISKLKQNFKQPTGKVLQNADVKACLSDLHNKYVFIPADKAPNNIIIICKRYYIKTLIKELGLDNCSTPPGNSTSCQMSFEDIVNTHDTFMKSLGIELSDDDKRLPYLYWTPELHKSPVKHLFIAGSSKCTTKESSSLLTKIQS